MPNPTNLQSRLDAANRAGPDGIDRFFEDEVRRRASDVHFEPTPAASG